MVALTRLRPRLPSPPLNTRSSNKRRASLTALKRTACSDEAGCKHLLPQLCTPAETFCEHSFAYAVTAHRQRYTLLAHAKQANHYNKQT